MPDSNADDDGRTNSIDRRSVLRSLGGAVVGGLGVTAVADTAEAGMIVGLDVKSNINLESGGVVPAVVKGIAPMELPVAEEVSITPRLGPSRLLACGQGQLPSCLQVLNQARNKGDGATPVHGDGHRQGKRSAMLHFRVQEADFIAGDVEDGEIDVTLLYAVEDGNGGEEAFVGTDTVKGIAPMD